MPLAVGARLGPYEVISALGAGGMGEVYKATDTRLDRAVAIKVLPAHIAADPLARERFEREAKVVSSLDHPHICPLFDVGEADGVSYLVMPCLEGETLGPSRRFSVSANGQRFLMNEPGAGDPLVPITVILNWTGLLRK